MLSVSAMSDVMQHIYSRIMFHHQGVIYSTYSSKLFLCKQKAIHNIFFTFTSLRQICPQSPYATLIQKFNVLGSVRPFVCMSNLSLLNHLIYELDQLISLKDSFINNSNSFVSVLKRNGIFKHEGSRGCKAGNSVKQKVYKIKAINSTFNKQPVSTHFPSRSNVTHSSGSSKDNLIMYSQT